jgi:hypothetical protein
LICKLHRKELLRDRVDNRVGYPPGPPEGYMEASRTLFPHSNLFSIGGCLVPQPKLVSVRYCPDCRLAEQEWRSTREVDEFWEV